MSNVYYTLHEEQRHLVARKKRLSAPYFNDRIRALRRYRDALLEAIRIGRDIGDTFAWFWYQRDTQLLLRHLERPANLELPKGIGGAGELSFITHSQFAGSHFLLYHGITHKLRLGDLSVIEPLEPRVVSLAELKTERSSSSRELRVTILGVRRGRGSAPSSQPPPLSSLGAQNPQRVRRQLKRMRDAFRPAHIDARVALAGQMYLEALERLIVRTKNEIGICWTKPAEGLLLFAVRHGRHRTLAGRLLDTRRLYLKRLRLPPLEQRKSLYCPEAADNALLIGTVDLKGEGPWIPALWLGIDSEFLCQVLTRRISVWSAYNPAFFFAKLRSSGFEVSRDDIGRTTIVLKRPTLTARTNDISRPLESIGRHLFREETVIEMFLEPAKKIERGEMPRFEEITVELHHFLGPVPSHS